MCKIEIISLLFVVICINLLGIFVQFLCIKTKSTCQEQNFFAIFFSKCTFDKQERFLPKIFERLTAFFTASLRDGRSIKTPANVFLSALFKIARRTR